MASLCRDKNGTRRIVVKVNGRRRPIRLGRMPIRIALTFKARVDILEYALASNTTPDPETAAWAARLSPELFEKLESLGLVPPRPRQEGDAGEPRGPTLGAFLAEHVERRIDVKPATKEVWSQVVRNLKECFGGDREIVTIDEGAAEDFKMYLVGQSLAATTIHKRLQFARGFFRAAMKRKLVASNPFAEVTAKAALKNSRERFIAREEVDQLLEACPNVDWKAIVALARYGGLRCPSEVLSLEWRGVDWDRGQFHVESPKTAHHPGKASRAVPLFPELRAVLGEAFEVAPEGARYVVGGRYRDAATGPNGWRNCNLRTQFERIVKRAGLTPWPRLFHALRASRETELAQVHPIHVVTAWLGNTPRVALKHYLMVTEADFAKAAGRGEAARQAARENGKAARQAARDISADTSEHEQETTQAPVSKGFVPMLAEAGGIISGEDRIRRLNHRMSVTRS